jgi:hypothetical protein
MLVQSNVKKTKEMKGRGWSMFVSKKSSVRKKKHTKR